MILYEVKQMNTEGKIYAKYKGQTYQLITIKALLRAGDKKDVWANVTEIQVIADEANAEKKKTAKKPSASTGISKSTNTRLKRLIALRKRNEANK